MSKLAYDDSWADELTNESHDWRSQDLLPETKALMEENERIKTERKRRQLNREKLSYSEPLAIEIAERISSGELLINVCNDEHMPTMRRVTQLAPGELRIQFALQRVNQRPLDDLRGRSDQNRRRREP